MHQLLGGEAVATAMAVGKRLKKIAVLSGNCFGFIGNRMLEPYQQQALALLAHDGATPAAIDAALRKFGLAMGIFQMADLAGNDVGWRIRQGLGLTDPDTRDPTIPYPSAVADMLCERGRFGQKTGGGWYKYDPAKPRVPLPDPAVAELIAQHFGRPVTDCACPFDDGEIVARVLYPLVNEGFKVLHDKIALRASDIDVVWVAGYGWPKHTGGPMFWARDVVGLREVWSKLEQLAAEHPDVPYFKTTATVEEWEQLIKGQ